MLILLLALFIVKHFLADYVWQTQYMMRKGAATSWLLPLVAHCAVHMALTLAITLPFAGNKAIFIMVVDGLLHFIVDGIKARWLKYPFPRKAFWVSLGADQMCHHLTYLALAYLALH